MRDVAYEMAFRICRRTHDGLAPVSAARKAIEGFAKLAGILEISVTPPWMVASGAGRGGVPT
ncbi:DUF982 domain-containing protein [Mesorhizobium sp. IMUNJ 23232]|uniref:DUF982 domain-containing protein n=1 Tax=Mesorhizobium sp. IMUNJ 23232 TaxID=3376064 RepID=UPI0037A4AD49